MKKPYITKQIDSKITTIEIKSCYGGVDENKKGRYGCLFFRNTMDGMECGHPYYDDKEAYKNHIIDIDNRHGIPDKCPLRRDDLMIKVSK